MYASSYAQWMEESVPFLLLWTLASAAVAIFLTTALHYTELIPFYGTPLCGAIVAARRWQTARRYIGD
jgi:hypothetical protein